MTKAYKSNKDLLKDEKRLGYISGLIATDGNLNPQHKAIELCLNIKDEETVKFFASTLVENPIINYRFNKNQARFAATFHELYDFLFSIGITPRKSATLKLDLSNQGEEFLRYFLRGFIDGDGCVDANDKGLNKQRIILYSGSPFLLDSLLPYYPFIHSCISSRDTTGHEINIRGKSYYMGESSINRAEFQGTRAKVLAWYLPVDDFTMKRKTEKILKLRDVKAKQLRADYRLWFGEDGILGPNPDPSLLVFPSPAWDMNKYRADVQALLNAG